MTDLTSVAREAAEAEGLRRIPPQWMAFHGGTTADMMAVYRKHFIDGFTECASRIPNVTEFAEALFDADGDAESGIEWTPFAEQSPGVRGAYLFQARAVCALIGERLKQ